MNYEFRIPNYSSRFSIEQIIIDSEKLEHGARYDKKMENRMDESLFLAYAVNGGSEHIHNPAQNKHQYNRFSRIVVIVNGFHAEKREPAEKNVHYHLNFLEFFLVHKGEKYSD